MVANCCRLGSHAPKLHNKTVHAELRPLLEF